jgi:hypothetical protein
MIIVLSHNLWLMYNLWLTHIEGTANLSCISAVIHKANDRTNTTIHLLTIPGSAIAQMVTQIAHHAGDVGKTCVD